MTAWAGITEFQSTLPARGATAPPGPLWRSSANFNPRSPHGERPMYFITSARWSAISIHAPRTGSDKHADLIVCDDVVFQSTLPARGATVRAAAVLPRGKNFNPRSPHGERRHRSFRLWQQSGISIHAPRTGSDVMDTDSVLRVRTFQSTLPARGATVAADVQERGDGISIHAPRTGSDRSSVERKSLIFTFQSTLPARGATPVCAFHVGGNFCISIHAPRTGSDRDTLKQQLAEAKFQSTLPARGATSFRLSSNGRMSYFNPRSPHGERR